MLESIFKKSTIPYYYYGALVDLPLGNSPDIQIRKTWRPYSRSTTVGSRGPYSKEKITPAVIDINNGRYNTMKGNRFKLSYLNVVWRINNAFS